MANRSENLRFPLETAQSHGQGLERRGATVLAGFAVAVALFVLIGAAWWLLMKVPPRWHGVLPATAHHRMQ